MEHDVSRVHRSWLPYERLLTSKVRYSITNRCANDAHCRGGDAFEILVRDDEEATWVMIADVSSNGSLGVLHAEMLRSAFRAAITRRTCPSAVIARLNDVRFDTPSRDLQAHFASAFVGRIDAVRPELSYASAGHDIALLFTGRAHRHLDPTGPLLGILPGADHGDRTVTFETAALLVVATDGITEARCAAEPAFEFGTSGLVGAVLRSGFSKSAAEEIALSTDSFTAGYYRDDATVAVLQRDKGTTRMK
jgi:sigma-B regulation protein RsbU (phosphoserine phosphatase)